MDRSRSYAVKVLKDHPVVTSFLVCLVASAILNRTLAKKAERRNPPTGRFVTIDGVRLHYVERGTGRPLVLLHGNGSMIQDFESSGLIDLAAMKYRVIAFDRPGFGHSDRPRRTVWTPEAQAALLVREAVGRELGQAAHQDRQAALADRREAHLDLLADVQIVGVVG